MFSLYLSLDNVKRMILKEYGYTDADMGRVKVTLTGSKEAPIVAIEDHLKK